MADGPHAGGEALAPLRIPVFRMLWLTWLASHVCMWMNDVAAAWLMTSLTTSPVLVAMVQTAATLPVFLLGLPSGALADIVDRRRLFAVTQFWVAAVALLSCALISGGLMNAQLLLLLTFANGIGLALRWPVFAAIVPELVPRAQLPAALGLNGIAMNASRIIGPLIAGSIIATAGSVYVYALNAVVSLAAALAILGWRREQKASVLPGERFLGAIRVGVRYVRESTRMRPLLLRVVLFFFHSVAALALLPLLAHEMHGVDATVYTLLLASLGAGAIASVLLMPRLRRRWDGDRLARHGGLLQAGAAALVAVSPNLYVAMPMMFLNGMAWIVVANSLSVSAQLALPDWVRARAMSIFQMALMGANALGALCWGKVAGLTDIRTALLCASASSVVCLLLTRRFRIPAAEADAQRVVRPFDPPTPAGEIAPDAGPVLTMIEYRIQPSDLAAFLAVMEQTRRSRLQQGSVSWELFRRTDDPTLFIEYVVDETWVDHLRRFERFTSADLDLRKRRLSLHRGDQPPTVTRTIGQPLRALG